MQNFDHEHPLYAPNKSRRKLALDFYHGGQRITGEYLQQHPAESPLQFSIRKSRAAYRNYCAPIVDVFNAAINEGRPDRIIPAQLDPLQVDADLSGTSANAFFQRVTADSAAGGVAFVAVDMLPKQGETLADDTRTERERLPYFISIDPDEIIDWAADRRGLKWYVRRYEEYRNPEPFQDGEKVTVVEYWTRDAWARYEKAEKGEYALVDEGKNELGEIPLVPFLYEETSAMTGNPVTDDVLDLILKLFRKDSEKDKLEFDSCIPLLVAIGVDAEQIKEAVKASSQAWALPADSNVQYVEPSGVSSQIVAQSITDLIQSIREISMRQVKPASAMVESAEAKRIDQSQIYSQFAVFARYCGGQEANCWLLAAKWMGIDAGEILTPYREDYDVAGIDYQLSNALIGMQRSNVLSKLTLWEALKGMGVLPDDFDPEKEKERIQIEVGEQPLGAGIGAGLPQIPL